MPLALVSSRLAFRGKAMLTGLLLLPLILPPFVGAIGLRHLLGREGSLNALLLKLGLVDHGIDFVGAGGFWAVVLLETLSLYPIVYLNLAAALSPLAPLATAKIRPNRSSSQLTLKAAWSLRLSPVEEKPGMLTALPEVWVVWVSRLEPVAGPWGRKARSPLEATARASLRRASAARASGAPVRA